LLKVYVECYADEVLFEFIVRQKSRREIDIIHAGSKSRVIRKVTETLGSIGLIDEDSGSGLPKEMKEMIEEFDDPYTKVRIYGYKNCSKLIELRPRLEEWILRICDQSNIDPRKYSLPRDPELLHKTINQKLKKFQKLLEDLHKNSKILREFINIVNKIIEETEKYASLNHKN